MGVFQPDRALGRFADVGDDILRADRVAAYQFSHRRSRRRLRVEEEAGALAFKEGDAPAVGVDVGTAASSLESTEGKTDVRRDIAIHAE